MWYPFKNYRKKMERRREFKQQYEGKFALCQADPMGEARGLWETYFFLIPWDEYDIDFAEICMEILGELLKPFQVTAYIDTWNFIGEKPDRGLETYGWLPSERAPAYHQKILTAQTKKNEGLQSIEGYLISLAGQLDRPLAAVMDSQPKKSVFNHFCLYCNRTAPSSAVSPDGLQWAMGRRACDLWIEFQTLPDELTVEVNVSPPDTDAIVKIVQQVCCAYGKELLVEVDV